MRVIVVQAASGPHETLLRLSEPWHRAYCARHLYEYRCLYGVQQPARGPTWDKVALLYDILLDCKLGTLVIWLDADVLIERPQEPLAAALLASADVGMVRSTVGELNAGVVLIRTSARTLAWIERVWQRGPVPGARYHEQSRMNAELHGLAVAELDNRYNSYRWAAGPRLEPAILRAWHAEPMPFRLAMIQRRLRYLAGTDTVFNNIAAHFERDFLGG